MEFVGCNLPVTLSPAVATLPLSAEHLPLHLSLRITLMSDNVPLMLAAPLRFMAVTVSLTVPFKPTVMVARMPVVEPPREAH